MCQQESFPDVKDNGVQGTFAIVSINVYDRDSRYDRTISPILTDGSTIQNQVVISESFKEVPSVYPGDYTSMSNDTFGGLTEQQLTFSCLKSEFNSTFSFLGRTLALHMEYVLQDGNIKNGSLLHRS